MGDCSVCVCEEHMVDFLGRRVFGVQVVVDVRMGSEWSDEKQKR